MAKLMAEPEAAAVDESAAKQRGEAIDRAIRAWFIEHIHNSPVSRDTAAINHLQGTLKHLRARILEV